MEFNFQNVSPYKRGRIFSDLCYLYGVIYHYKDNYAQEVKEASMAEAY